MRGCGVLARMKWSWVLMAWCLLVSIPVCAAETGKELYEAACASCHGRDGRGAPEGSRIQVPLPDFADCPFVTAETTGNWVALVADGGPALGLSDQMPSFSDSLSEEQIREVIAYLRGFCPDPSWPAADLNFRRLLVTGKAFPEDEAVWTVSFEKSRESRSLVNEFIFEKRLGARGQVEVTLPIVYNDPKGSAATGGVGDLELQYKHVLLASREYGAIASLALDLVLPTGDRDRGLGDGTVGLGPSLRAGKTLGPFVMQGEIKAVLPADVDLAARRLLYRAALQLPLSPLKSGWVTALEFEADTKIEGQSRDVYSLAPMIYKGLSKRGHVAFAVGAKIPVAGAQAFDYQIGAFLLWEYLDGGLWW